MTEVEQLEQDVDRADDNGYLGDSAPLYIVKALILIAKELAQLNVQVAFFVKDKTTRGL